MSKAEQLGALADLHRVFESDGIEYWLFGGWAVDFHAGAVTRPHADVDLAVWLADYPRIAEVLRGNGWMHAPGHEDDGSTAYERGAARVELAFLARDDGGSVYTPLRAGRANWADGAFDTDVAELCGVRARVISLASLRIEKSQPQDDPVAAAKDRADLATLASL